MGKITIVSAALHDARHTRKSEGDVIKLKDGRLLLVHMEFLGDGSDFAETRIVAAESVDEGLTWSLPQTTGLRTPESCPELTRVPETGDMLMIWNNTGYDPDFRSHYGRRSPLTSAISCDGGRTWGHIRNIEEDPGRAFSNPCCRFTGDGKAIINYWTCKYLPDMAMQSVIDLRVAVITTDWFYER